MQHEQDTIGHAKSGGSIAAPDVGEAHLLAVEDQRPLEVGDRQMDGADMGLRMNGHP